MNNARTGDRPTSLKVWGLIFTVGVAVSSIGCANQTFSPKASIPGVADQAPDQRGETGAGDTNLQDPTGTIERYQQRYDLADTHQKLVDDKGNGYAGLYGVRNFRAVLSGVVYRGGANNLYNKYGKRSNMNPLPDLGLKNLCQEGFGQAVYLYPTNFASAPKETNCTTTVGGAKSKLTYSHYTPFSDAQVLAVFDKVQTALTHPESGPIYLHCWNGWHASGLISALILRQYCRMDGERAVKYWELNTDGNAPEKQYGDIRKRIRDFKPKAAYAISADLARQVCPN